ncbi:hypothetical protein [Streptomyces sp. NPDC050704]|uniref:hypothetical protein n=1 Tax=Streptomyces sp. NPDC050704 TaxID=3157219 RepID=UPI0034458B6D
MTPTYAETGRRHRILLPASAESVSQVSQETQWTQGSHGAQQPLDPPIYRAMVRTWADRGRTLPGRHDPEWVRLAAPSALYGYGQFNGFRDPRDDGR